MIWFVVLWESKHPPKHHLVNILEHFNYWNKCDNATLKASDVALFARVRPRQLLNYTLNTQHKTEGKDDEVDPHIDVHARNEALAAELDGDYV